VKAESAVFRPFLALAGAVIVCAGCAPIPSARTSADAPPTGREIEARRTYREASCAASTGLFFPGLGQHCQRRYAESAVLTSLALAELGTAVGAGLASGEVSHPSVSVPLIGLQNLWLAGYGNALFVEQQARGLRFVPQDSLGELALAPFNPRVLSRIDVWLGLMVQLGAGTALSLALSDDSATGRGGDDANIFGRRFDPVVGYPLAGGLGGALFTHVAIGEETLFRGMIQSEMARRNGEVEGWIGSSLDRPLGLRSVNAIEHHVHRPRRQGRVLRVAGNVRLIHLKTRARQVAHLLSQHVGDRHQQLLKAAVVVV
jgi:membrane protease YdiL (CAAX protease family)